MQWDKPHKKVQFGETSIYEIMCFLSTGYASHWSTTKLLRHTKTTVLWSEWRKKQNFTVAVAKDYMSTNKVWETKEISYTQQWNKSTPSLSNLEKIKILWHSNTKNVAAKTKNLYLNLRQGAKCSWLWHCVVRSVVPTILRITDYASSWR